MAVGIRNRIYIHAEDVASGSIRFQVFDAVARSGIQPAGMIGIMRLEYAVFLLNHGYGNPGQQRFVRHVIAEKRGMLYDSVRKPFFDIITEFRKSGSIERRSRINEHPDPVFLRQIQSVKHFFFIADMHKGSVDTGTGGKIQRFFCDTGAKFHVYGEKNPAADFDLPLGSHGHCICRFRITRHNFRETLFRFPVFQEIAAETIFAFGQSERNPEFRDFPSNGKFIHFVLQSNSEFLRASAFGFSFDHRRVIPGKKRIPIERTQQFHAPEIAGFDRDFLQRKMTQPDHARIAAANGKCDLADFRIRRNGKHVDAILDIAALSMQNIRIAVFAGDSIRRKGAPQTEESAVVGKLLRFQYLCLIAQFVFFARRHRNIAKQCSGFHSREFQPLRGVTMLTQFPFPAQVRWDLEFLFETDFRMGAANLHRRSVIVPDRQIACRVIPGQRRQFTRQCQPFARCCILPGRSGIETFPFPLVSKFAFQICTDFTVG